MSYPTIGIIAPRLSEILTSTFVISGLQTFPFGLHIFLNFGCTLRLNYTMVLCIVKKYSKGV